MGLAGALYALSSEHPALKPISADRVYPVRLPDRPDLTHDDELPALVYHLVDDVESLTHDSTGSRKELTRTRVQWDCWAEDYDGALALEAALRAAFRGYRGTVAGVRIDSMLPESGLDGFDEVSKRFRRIVDVIVWFQEV